MKYGRGGPKRYISRDLKSAEVAERAFQASCGFDLHVHVHAGRRTLLNVHKERIATSWQNNESTQNASKSGTKTDTGAEGRSTADEYEFSEISEVQNASTA